MAGKRDLFEQAMTKGHSAAWDQQWDKAMAYYRASLTEFPDDPKALTSLGFAMLQADRPEEALAVYQRAAALTPGDPVAPEKCGEIFERLGRLNEAAQTYMAVAEIHLTRRDVQKAIDNWSRVVRITPDNLNAHSRLALAHERSGRPHEAVAEYLEVARIFQRGGDNEKAAQAANRALQLDPKSAEARDTLDKLRRGAPIPVPQRTKAAMPRGTGMLSAQEAHAGLFAFEESAAEPAHKRASPLAAAQEVALEQMAEMLFEEDADTSKTTGSVSVIAKGTGLLRGGGKPNRAQAIMYLGQAIGHQTSREIDAAVANYENAISSGLDSPLVSFALGALYLELNRPADAIEHLKPATARDDVGLGAFFGLGEAYRREGKAREALTHLLEALKRLDLQLVAPQKQDRLAEAYESVTDGLLRGSETELAQLAKNLVGFLSGEGWEERAKQARQNLDTSAEDGQVEPLVNMIATPGGERVDKVLESMRLIDQHMSRQMWATAMEEAFYAIQHSPSYLPVHTRMAEILVAENRPEAAALKYRVTAESYRVRGENSRAARLLQEVLRLNPLDVEMRARLIGLLREQGKADEALQQYFELADTYYQLTDLDSAREKFAEGLQLAQRSGGDRSWSVKFLKKLGDIDMQRLAWREALRAYEQVKTLDPADGDTRISLIDLNFRLGNSKQGVAELDDYLKMLFAARNLEQAKLLLEELANSYPNEPALSARLQRLAAS